MSGWRELKKFCDRVGWELYKDTDHYFYRKMDDEGNTNLTKVFKDELLFTAAFMRKFTEILEEEMEPDENVKPLIDFQA